MKYFVVTGTGPARIIKAKGPKSAIDYAVAASVKARLATEDELVEAGRNNTPVEVVPEKTPAAPAPELSTSTLAQAA